MGSDLNRSFAIYPMVEEGEATGVVAGVYAQILDVMPFVPSVFKSLALCPGYLVLAWAQASAVLSHDAFSGQVTQLVGSVQHAAQPPDDEDCRAALARFVEPLGKMLLLSAGLLEAVEGRLPGSPASPSPPAPEPVRPSRPAPSQWDADNPQLYGQIRAALDTPIVNSIWRALADAGLLAASWEALAPQVERTRAIADRLQSDAVASTRQIRWPVVASPQALAQADIADAAPGVGAILDAYVKTLPRVLALVASSAEPLPGNR